MSAYYPDDIDPCDECLLNWVTKVGWCDAIIKM